MKRSLCLIAAVGAIAYAMNSYPDSRKDPSSRTYESSYSSLSTTTTSDEDRAYIYSSLETGSNPYQKSDPQQQSIEGNPYYNNSLSTGSSPYASSGSISDESQISVKTSSNSNCDVVVIVKRSGRIYANAYIVAGDTYTFNIPNGTYQVFFYGGRGWNPYKHMPGGRTGGFVANESYSKDSSVSLNYQILEYELIPQPNGNFSTQQSNASEIF